MVKRPVAVVVGVGGMGRAIAERIGPGTRLLVADSSEPTLTAASEHLRRQGFDVSSVVVDVSSRRSVAALARRAADAADVRYVAHTAGLAPTGADVSRLLAINMVGVALTLEEFGSIVAAGGAGVVIASTAAHRGDPFSVEQANLLAATPADELLDLTIADPSRFPDSMAAYSFSKRANLVRVEAASVTWGLRGARVNVISPGIVATPMLARPVNAQLSLRSAQLLSASYSYTLSAELRLGPALET
jgi:NAD(P)-dependent dehydrogenase (short-subunit alcohol dehydrogenase family)